MMRNSKTKSAYSYLKRSAYLISIWSSFEPTTSTYAKDKWMNGNKNIIIKSNNNKKH